MRGIFRNWAAGEMVTNESSEFETTNSKCSTGVAYSTCNALWIAGLYSTPTTGSRYSTYIKYVPLA